MVVAEAAIAEDGQKEENMHKPKWHTPIKFNQSKFNFLPNTFPIWLLSPIDGAMIPRHARDGTAFVCVHDFSPTTSMAVHVRRERCTLRCVIYRVDSIKSKKCILTIDESNTKVLRSRQTKKKNTPTAHVPEYASSSVDQIIIMDMKRNASVVTRWALHLDYRTTTVEVLRNAIEAIRWSANEWMENRITPHQFDRYKFEYDFLVQFDARRCCLLLSAFV